MTVTYLIAEQQWECPNCPTVDVTPTATPNRFHVCAGLKGLTAPLVRVGTKVKVSIVEREDYVGDETVTTVDGRPIMAVRTEREDGSNDVIVYAPLATAKAEEL